MFEWVWGRGGYLFTARKHVNEFELDIMSLEYLKF